MLAVRWTRCVGYGHFIVNLMLIHQHDLRRSKVVNGILVSLRVIGSPRKTRLQQMARRSPNSPSIFVALYVGVAVGVAAEEVVEEV